ncbi:MAG: ParA family protein [Neisseriaceae bacterium]|nr:MAG: ParA family protein [Neisseriaceae bacterium]
MTPKIIAIAHQKGGVGKTTIAANLAVELDKICNLQIIDLDMQKSLSYFNQLRISNGFNALNMLSVNNPNDLKSVINNNQNTLLIDVGGFDSDINRIAILGADVIYTPVSDSGVEIVGLLAFRNILREMRQHRPGLHANVLLNRIHPNANNYMGAFSAFVDKTPEFLLCNSVLRERADYKRSFDRGLSVVETNCKASKEINDLVQEIINA